jgi:hypothetical protein
VLIFELFTAGAKPEIQREVGELRRTRENVAEILRAKREGVILPRYEIDASSAVLVRPRRRDRAPAPLRSGAGSRG